MLQKCAETMVRHLDAEFGGKHARIAGQRGNVHLYRRRSWPGSRRTV
jgi:hypothetical protein